MFFEVGKQAATATKLLFEANDSLGVSENILYDFVATYWKDYSEHIYQSVVLIRFSRLPFDKQSPISHNGNLKEEGVE